MGKLFNPSPRTAGPTFKNQTTAGERRPGGFWHDELEIARQAAGFGKGHYLNPRSNNNAAARYRAGHVAHFTAAHYTAA